MPSYWKNRERIDLRSRIFVASRRCGLLMRMVAGTHERSRFYVAETELQGFVFHELEFRRRVEARDRQVILGRTKILPHCENIHAAIAQIAENFNQLFHSLAESDHHAALGHHPWREFLGVLK